jgi:hypothetical protein
LEVQDTKELHPKHVHMGLWTRILCINHILLLTLIFKLATFFSSMRPCRIYNAEVSFL